MTPCYACHSNGPFTAHPVREMFSGTREVFEYRECNDCGLFELQNIPTNMGKYYDHSYYAFGKLSGIRSFLKSKRAAVAFGHFNPIGLIMAAIFGYPPIVKYLRRIKSDVSHRILDVGCGNGIALRDLTGCGFAALDGVDPHLAADTFIDCVRLFKRELFEIKDRYDVIILNHSFEHMDHQDEVLTHISKILSPNGWLIIRIPLIGDSWQKFGANWYGIHAPRHFSIHTLRSFRKVIDHSPFQIAFQDHDSDWRHNLSSRKYSKDISTNTENFFSQRSFSRKEISAAKAEAKIANTSGSPDQASFYLRHRGQ